MRIVWRTLARTPRSSAAVVLTCALALGVFGIAVVALAAVAGAALPALEAARVDAIEILREG